MSRTHPNETDERKDPATLSRSRIIANAAEKCHTARSQLIRARYGDDPALLEGARRKLQRCCLDYFFSLRPLSRDGGELGEFWDGIELWESRTREGSREVRGLEVLEEIAMASETRKVESESFAGKSAERKEDPVILEAPVLLRISTILDRAAQLADLGPDVPEGSSDDHGFEYEDVLQEPRPGNREPPDPEKFQSDDSTETDGGESEP